MALHDPEARLTQALAAARSEAARRGHDRIATRHLLLGVLAVPDSAATAVVRALGADPAKLSRRVCGSLPRSRRPHDGSGLPYSANARRALDAAEREARTDSSPVRMEHVLFALLELGGGVARLLFEDGVSAESARDAWQRLMALGSPGLPFVQVDARSSVPVYQQIVDQVREAVAAGRLRPGARLPTVRQLAADLDVAPGTTARAYQELEQLGVVSTERARGTRVAELRPAEVSDPERAAALVSLLRPVAVSASYLGASADEIRSALEQALAGISLQRGAAP